MATMSTTPSHRLDRRATRRHRDRATRLRIEHLEDRQTPSLSAGTEVPGQLLIRFESNVTTASIADFYADHGLTELENLDFDRTDADPGLRLVATPTILAAELIPTLQLDSRVKYAEPNGIIHLAQVPNDPTLSRDYGLINTGQTGGTPDADTDADEAWDITTGSSEVVVAVIDSGIDYTHPDLAANVWVNPGEIPGNRNDDDGNGFVDDVHGYDIMNNDGDPMDTFGHGTAVAGTIGMVGDNATGSTGVSWNVKLMAVTMRDEFMTFENAIKAMDYVTMMRKRGVNVRVANASWGAWDLTASPKSLKDAVDRMGEAGILFVAAANNQARDVDVQPHYPSGFDSPHIVSVAATDHNDRYSSFTNWGATTVDLAAPGEFVWTTGIGNSYGWANGTSLSAPHVTGAAALLFSAFPHLTALEVKARLLGSVDPIGHIGANAAFPTLTNGRLNVRNALLWTPPDGETVPPATVGSLAVASTSPWSATLSWTATGDDGATGRAVSYDVRYSSAPITAANWSAAIPTSGEPAPRTAGSIETFTVTGLEPATLYYFAIQANDNDGNTSAISNVAQSATAPARFLLNDNVESDVGNWIPTGLWHRSNVRGHDSATAWYLGKDSDRTYFNGTQHQETLTLATPIDLSGVTQAILRFDEWRQVGDFLVPLDASRVMASRNGSDWTLLSESFHPTLDWEQRTFDLAAFVGGPVYIRFDFNVNAHGLPPTAITQGYEGWHVDNIQVLVAGTQATGISVSDVRLAERNTGTTQAIFTVTRSSGAGQATVRFTTADGSATAASGDYQTVVGTLTFQPGEMRKTVAVSVNGDRLAESDESFFLNLGDPTGASIADGQGRANIRDDEPRIHATGQLARPEGDKAITLPMAVNLSVPSSEMVTVHYATADLTAVAGTDYLPTSGVLTFAPGETRKVIDITLPKDMTPDADVEAFAINFSDVSSNAVLLKRGVVHIVDFGEKSQGNHFGNGGALALAGIGGWSVDATGIRSARVGSPTWVAVVRSADNPAGWNGLVESGTTDAAELYRPVMLGESNRKDRNAMIISEVDYLLGHKRSASQAIAVAIGADTQLMWVNAALADLWSLFAPSSETT
jgi:subtilisin family serine protease